MNGTTGRSRTNSTSWVSAFRCGCGLLGLLLVGCFDLDPEPVPVTYGTITDPRDSQVYRTLTIEGMTWMQQDLNFQAPGSVCPDTTSVCALRLYSWSIAMGVDSQFDTTLLGSSSGFRQGVCPTGWHLPTLAEWLELERVMNLPGLPEDWATNDETGFGLKGWYQSGNERHGIYWIPEEAGSSTARAAKYYIHYDMIGPHGVLEVKQPPGIKKAKVGIRCLLDGA